MVLQVALGMSMQLVCCEGIHSSDFTSLATVLFLHFSSFIYSFSTPKDSGDSGKSLDLFKKNLYTNAIIKTSM